jgi:outer membrane protein assembly factor BamE
MVVIALPACSVADLPFVYRPEVRQGTVISEEAVAQLEPGMTRAQVRFLLGTPSIDDPFRQSRWDYVYRVKSGDGELLTAERVTVFFEDDRLIAAQGSYIPESSALAQAAAAR